MLTNLCFQESCFPRSHPAPHRPAPRPAPHQSVCTAISGYSPTTTASAWGPSCAPRSMCRASFAGMPVANVSAWCRKICCAASRQLHQHWWGDITPLLQVYGLTGPPHTHARTHPPFYHPFTSFCHLYTVEFWRAEVWKYCVFTSFSFILPLKWRLSSSSVVSSPNRFLFSVLQQKARANYQVYIGYCPDKLI